MIESLDVVAIGNAIVDVIARADDDFILRHGLQKGAMRLIDAEEARTLYDKMGAAIEVSGGSAANTAAGVAALGRRAGFIGQVSADLLGAVFAHDIKSLGVHFETPPLAEGPPTARCLIMVTPDAQRTLNTFLGASQFLPETSIDEPLIAAAKYLFLEGYLWDPPEPRAAMRRAIAVARSAGARVAFTVSDIFCIERHRADFLALLTAGEIDILFANEAEICSLAELTDFEAAVTAIASDVPMLVATRGERGAIAIADGVRHEVSAEPVTVVDTTGAGDLFAAGFLSALCAGAGLDVALKMGAVAAGEVIGHFGARPEADLRALMVDRLGVSAC